MADADQSPPVQIAPNWTVLLACLVGVMVMSAAMIVPWPWMLLALVAGAVPVWRAARMGVTADAEGITIRNWGRDETVRWPEVDTIRVGPSDNATGRVTMAYIRRRDGSEVACRAMSSYSAAQVEEWRTELLAVRR